MEGLERKLMRNTTLRCLSLALTLSMEVRQCFVFMDILITWTWRHALKA